MPLKFHRYHFYDSARQPDGDVAAGQSLYFYETSVGSTLATLYDAAGDGVSNPVTIPTDGVIDVYAECPLLWVYATGDSERRPIYAMGSPDGQLNVKDFGAQGDGTTDDTDAFKAAIAVQRAQSIYNHDYGGGWHSNYTEPIYIPPGKYMLQTGEFHIDYRGACFIGAGRENTFLAAISGYDSDIMFEFGIFDAEPSSPDYYWAGTACRYTFRDMAIIRDATDTWIDSYTLNRQGVAIQDNGCGDAHLNNVIIRGFEYGYCAAYGADFLYFYDVQIMWCDVGMYLGPASEQAQFYGLDVGLCNENIVLDGAVNCMFYGIDTSTPAKNDYCSKDAHDIVIEGGAVGQETRMGVTYVWSTGCRSISFFNLWEERVWGKDVAGWADPTNIDAYIYFDYTGSPSSGHANIIFDNPFVGFCAYSGDGAYTNNAWIAYADVNLNNSNVLVRSPYFTSTQGFDMIVRINKAITSYGTLTIQEPYFNGVGVGSPTVEWINNGGEPMVGFRVEAARLQYPYARDGLSYFAHGYASRLNLLNQNGNGIQLYGDTNRLNLAYVSTTNLWNYASIYPSEGKIGLGNAERFLKFDSAAPTTGTWTQGSVVFNTGAAASGKVGWVCVTGGTPGTWKPFGVIDS